MLFPVAQQTEKNNEQFLDEEYLSFLQSVLLFT